MNHKCSVCGSSDHVVLVWESIVLYKKDMPPKHIGCKKCNEMEKCNARPKIQR